VISTFKRADGIVAVLPATTTPGPRPRTPIAATPRSSWLMAGTFVRAPLGATW
jgi:hypothetical protein